MTAAQRLTIELGITESEAIEILARYAHFIEEYPDDDEQQLVNRIAVAEIDREERDFTWDGARVC